MLYKKNSAEKLPYALFKNPTSEYRGTPFWAWNCKLDREELLRQIEILKEMGMGGFHMHVRYGMDTKYLSDEFMSLIKSCVDKAEKENMLAWLYDEDRWPSGFAGGYVTHNRKYRMKNIRISPNLTPDHVLCDDEDPAPQHILIAKFDIVLDKNGCLANYTYNPKSEPFGKMWYVYAETMMKTPRYNGQTYIDALMPETVEEFIKTTYIPYKYTVGDKFDTVVPAIFTDEPQHQRKSTLSYPDALEDVVLPWTDDLDKTYAETYGTSLVDHIPELIWELPDGKPSVVRYNYHDHVAERFARAYFDQCGDWCRENNLGYTGHNMAEPTLQSQTSMCGEAMRHYRKMSIPGIDMLCHRFEFNTAKQCQSAVNQFGKEAMMSELYGVTSWDYDFRGHKINGDWQAAAGVTVRVPHLSWVSMKGEAKRDYPASINYQSPWYKKYSYIEDHFARVNTVMTRGKPVVKVGVIHPIETYWMHWGPSNQTALKRDTLDANFDNLTKWLIKGSIDFDFISESLLPSLNEHGGYPFRVGQMQYDAIIVPDCETLRSTTYERLEQFLAAGGKLIFMGSAPKFENAVESARGMELYAKSKVVSFSRGAVLEALEDCRTVDIRNSNGTLTDNLMYRMRDDGKVRNIFIAHAADPYNKSLSQKQNICINIRGLYSVKLYDTITGNIIDLPYIHANGNTMVNAGIYMYDSLLLSLTPSSKEYVATLVKPTGKAIEIPVDDFVPCNLDEPNVLLLDMAEYALDDEEYKPREEILRLDSYLRDRLGWQRWGEGALQPWLISPETIEHKVRLRFSINSKINIRGAKLALEQAEDAQVYVNGQPVDINIDGYYVDKAIPTFKLPDMHAGSNKLEVILPFGRRTATEWCYLLGNFGVEVAGSNATVVKLNKNLTHSDITRQGLAFYSGRLDYNYSVETHGGELSVRVPRWNAAVLTVKVDGKAEKTVAFAPYEVNLGTVKPGKHKVTVSAYINRTNGFGILHCADEKFGYPGPDAWRVGGDWWSYEYNLKSEGILTKPIINEILYD